MKKCKDCGELKPLSEYYSANKSKGLINWQSQCKECFKAQERKRYAEKMETDPVFATAHRARGRITQAMKKQTGKWVKPEHVEYLFGCTMAQLIKKIESTGYDPILHELDHTIPICMFNLVEEEHRRFCFHHYNIGVLTKEKHIRKWKRLILGWRSILIDIGFEINVNPNNVIRYIEDGYHG